LTGKIAFGFLNIDKPLHSTSHDVVAQVRRSFGIKKVGHAGTLDPLATGVLVVCVGAATRLSEYVMYATKHYRARVRLGITTDTYDAEGAMLRERDASHITHNVVEQVLATFLGEIEQIPPMYSAIKRGGRKLYELARAGEIVERAARQVRIDALSISDWSPPEFTLDVTCSAGTYIRSLAYDLGEVLGVGAHLAGLVRTASGVFTLGNAVALESLLNSADWMSYLISPDVVLVEMPVVQLDAVGTDHILHGRAVPADDRIEGVLGRAYDPDGHFIAIVRVESGLWRPEKVFLQE
jgi:tRNA pseudouridine55 synthase